MPTPKRIDEETTDLMQKESRRSSSDCESQADSGSESRADSGSESRADSGDEQENEVDNTRRQQQQQEQHVPNYQQHVINCQPLEVLNSYPLLQQLQQQQPNQEEQTQQDNL